MGKLYLIQAYSWLGGPDQGNSMNAAVYDHTSGTMFIHERYLGSPGEMLGLAAHESYHAQYGNNTEMGATVYEAYCPVA